MASGRYYDGATARSLVRIRPATPTSSSQLQKTVPHGLSGLVSTLSCHLLAPYRASENVCPCSSVPSSILGVPHDDQASRLKSNGEQ